MYITDRNNALCACSGETPAGRRRGNLSAGPSAGPVRHVPAPVAAVSAASRLSRQHFPSACCLALCPCGRGVQRAPADRRHMNTQGRGKGSLVQAVFGEDEQADTERRDHAASPGSGHQSGAGRTQGGSASGRGTAAQDSGVELYCTGLPVSWNREELRQLFEPFGHVTSVQVPQQTVHLQDAPLLLLLWCRSRLPSSETAERRHYVEDKLRVLGCSVERDLQQCQKRPAVVSKETYTSVNRDLH